MLVDGFLFFLNSKNILFFQKFWIYNLLQIPENNYMDDYTIIDKSIAYTLQENI